MPSTTIQARISAFENLASSPPHKSPNAYSDILESPLSPMLATPLQPVAAVTRPSPSPSPPNLGRKTSLIDLKDWVVEDKPSSPRIDSSRTPTQQAFTPRGNGAPLISFESPPRPSPKPKPSNLSTAMRSAPPQLPPRKPSYTTLKPQTNSLTADFAHRYPPLSIDSEAGKGPSAHAPSSSVSSFHSVSLSEDTEPSTPGSITNYISTFPMDATRSPPATRRTTDSDTTSLTESYEEVSTSSLASPNTERLINIAWDRAPLARKLPPKLPERPGSARPSLNLKSATPFARAASGSGSHPNSPIIRPTISAASSSSSIVTPYVPRRSAPPPPSRSSDRASIRSNATSHSSGSQHSHSNSAALLALKTKRLPPVPLGVRRRYEAVFTANIVQRRRAEKPAAGEKPALLTPGEARGRRAVGWRGLSVDLITGDELAKQNVTPADETVGPGEKLEGAIVRLVWQRSGLDRELLAEIWNECDITGQGALSMDAFVKGMWRIDEELRRAQAQAVKSATSVSGKYRAQKSTRAPPKLPTRPRDILR